MAAGAYRLIGSLAGLALGGAAEAQSIEGPRWSVVAINDSATPDKGDYHLQLTGGRLDARFGCNAIGGSYVVSGGFVSFSNIVSTEMACSEEAGSFEQAGVGILQDRLRIRGSGNDKFRLGNSVGTIDLRQNP